MRGIVGENLTSSVAEEYGSAFGTFLKNRRAGKKEKLSVCIGRDSRPSGEMLKSSVTDGLCKVGVDVIDLGLVTTPCIGIMVREIGCVVTTINDEPTGVFAHVPEPTAENLTGLCEAVKTGRAEIGFAQNPALIGWQKRPSLMPGLTLLTAADSILMMAGCT
jgi:phosphomannomutase